MNYDELTDNEKNTLDNLIPRFPVNKKFTIQELVRVNSNQWQTNNSSALNIWTFLLENSLAMDTSDPFTYTHATGQELTEWSICLTENGKKLKEVGSYQKYLVYKSKVSKDNEANKRMILWTFIFAFLGTLIAIISLLVSMGVISK